MSSLKARTIRRLVLTAFFVALLPAMTSCKEKASAPAQPIDDTATALLSEKELVSSLDGVWTTNENRGTDDAETVYRIRATEGGTAMQIMMDGKLFENVVDDVDVNQQTVALRADVRGIPELVSGEMWTLLRTPVSKGFTLRITFGNGQSDELSFVRRLAPDDIAKLDSALEELKGEAAVAPVESNAVTITLPGTEAYWQKRCDSPANFVFRVVCKDPQLKTKYDRLNEQLDGLEEIGYNASPDPDEAEVYALRSAIEKQLNACTHSQCIESTLSQWITYMDENHSTDDAIAD